MDKILTNMCKLASSKENSAEAWEIITKLANIHKLYFTPQYTRAATNVKLVSGYLDVLMNEYQAIW